MVKLVCLLKCHPVVTVGGRYGSACVGAKAAQHADTGEQWWLHRVDLVTACELRWVVACEDSC